MEHEPSEKEQQYLSIVKADISAQLEGYANLPDKQLRAQISQRRGVIASSVPFFHAQQYRTESEQNFRLVQIDQIVGGVSPSFETWGAEYSARAGRHIEVIKTLINGIISKVVSTCDRAINRVFHITDRKYEERIRLGEMAGIKGFGSIYWVLDGTHRVSVCKVLQLKQIPARVKTITPDSKLSSRELKSIKWWQSLAKAGLLYITEIQSASPWGLAIHSCGVLSTPPLPWIVWCNSVEEFVALNQIYEALYPESFKQVLSTKDNSQIPEEVLLNIENLRKFLGI